MTIFKDAMDKMVDHSCDEKTEEQLRACVLQNPRCGADRSASDTDLWQ